MPSAIPIPPKDSTIVVTDNTSNDVSTSKHGWAPKAPNDATKFLRGDATWAVPSGGMADPMTTAGDIIVRNASNATDRLAIDGAYAKLISLGAGLAPKWAAPWNYSEFFSDFLVPSAQFGWNAPLTGGGASAVLTTTGVAADHPGVIKFDTGGSNAAAYAGWYMGTAGGANECFVLGAGPIYFRTHVQVVGLSDGTNDAADRYGIGVFPGSNADWANGVYFEYSGNAAANWKCKTATASTRTTTDSGVTVAAGTWVTLSALITSTSVTFYVNDASVATITTNIPTTTMTPVLSKVKLAGTSATRTSLVDYWYHMKTLNTTR